VEKAEGLLPNNPSGKVILTGDRPTGPLHLGHLAGSLSSRVALQEIASQYVIIADLQALTTNFNDPSKVIKYIDQLILDYLSVGLVPEKNVFFVQSAIPALHELNTYYMNLVTLARLHRNPTVKQEMLDKGFDESVPVGFFSHPISQSADITAFQADLVPAGEDQKPLIEQANEIVRKFNSIYGPGCIKEVSILLSKTPRLYGIDGKSKASKSMNNAIFLSDDSTTVREKVFSMYTDPGHIKVSDPGRVEGNMVFHYLDAFYQNSEHLEDLKSHYTRGGLGDVEIKKLLYSVLEQVLEPIRERRAKITKDFATQVLIEGTKKANQVADSTINQVRERMRIWSPK
jgi:tryptophanyl-tRNA synthetase